jgi:gliding motility-associated-like protein
LIKALSHRIFGLAVSILILSAVGTANAQITSPKADASTFTVYPSDTVQSPVFIFYSTPGTDVVGEIKADPPVPGNYNFDWFKFNKTSLAFDQLLLSQTNIASSILSNLTEGGYQVRIRNGTDTDTSFIAWVNIDTLIASIDKTSDGKLRQTAFTCDYLTLSGAVSSDTFYYYDPVSKVSVLLKNGFRFLWTSDNNKLIIPNKDKILDPNTTYKPPYLDTWYILTATDSFGMEDVDSVLYESIQVGPDDQEPWFTFQFFDKADKEEFIDPPSPPKDSSPLRVKFTNKSVNGFTYEWIFSDSARSDIFANEITNEIDYEPEYTYTIPNNYYPAIVVTSEAGCVDTFEVLEPIEVLPSELDVPNVFSPDGNGTNDYFTVHFQSVKEFNIHIYDRAGKLVYKAEVKDMYSWDGWNGNVLDSKRPASPGAYFYVIDATGWDDKHYHKGQYRGVVYLYRAE